MSIYLKMAWRNIWRNLRRSILTISAIAFATILLIFMLSFQFGTYETMINSAVKIHTGYFQIQEKDYQDKKELRQVVKNPDIIGQILDRTPEVKAYTFRTTGFSLASSQERTYGIIVTGVDPEREASVSSLKKLVKKGEYLKPEDSAHALIGELLAKNLRVDVGDTVTLLGQGLDGSIAAAVVTVKGIFKSGQDIFDRNALQIPLKYFQDVWYMGEAVNEIVIVTDSLKTVSKTINNLSEKIRGINTKEELVILDWKALMPGLVQGIYMDLVGGLIFYLLLLIVVAFSILNTFLMAIFERTHEFGVLMAMGTTSNRLTGLLLTESIIMTGLGIISGIIFGSLLTLWFQQYGIYFGKASEMLAQYGISGRMYPRLNIFSILIGPALVFFITFWTALYPALKVRKMRPVEALTAL
ncbi:ABC transporter permease [Desulfobacterales bacterium HSG17]|nr:ABC transporter permease [Desulfobacterales bacterium HSG17]